MKEKQETSVIERITQQIATLKEQRNITNAETKIYVKKREKLNGQFKKMRQEINELEKKRDSINEEVKNLKQQRDEAHTKIRANIEKVKANSQKIAELKKKTSKESRRNLKKEFEDIEWKIQTTSLDMHEEKKLIEHVKQLETQLSTHKKIDKHTIEITKLKKEIEALETKADLTHEKLIQRAQESQEIHSKMMAQISKIKEVKAEANSMHDAYIQAREKVKPLNDEIKKLSEERKKLQDKQREENEKRKKNIEKALKEKLETQARNKLNRGEKLSLEEFKLLANQEPKDV